MPTAVSVQDDTTAETNGGEKLESRPKTGPVLAHRMKHDKSILALVVSSRYIFAGTQGGEILVRTSTSFQEDQGLIGAGLQPRDL